MYRTVRKNREKGYLGAHGDFDSISELFHALKHQCPGLNPKSNVFSSIVSAPIQPTTNLNHTRQNTCIRKERFKDRDIDRFYCKLVLWISPDWRCSSRSCNSIEDEINNNRIQSNGQIPIVKITQNVREKELTEPWRRDWWRSGTWLGDNRRYN